MRSQLLSFATLAASLAAQPFAAGFRDLGFPNTTGQGSANIACRVYYPATAAGRDAPLIVRAGGYPVVVFLHGFAALGSFYGPVGEALARAGYVTVMHDTAQFSGPTQVLDGLALYPALQVANAGPGVLQGALDMTRAGLCGHSMGGGSTLQILGRNPGYRLGVALAGVDNAAGAAAATVPLLFVHGLGDAIVNVSATDNNFAAAQNHGGVKTSYVLDGSANHTNVAGFALLNATDQAVWARVASVVVGFCDRYLAQRDDGLEAVFGASPRGEARLARTDTRVASAELWRDVAPRLGVTLQLGVVAEPGPAVLLIAAGETSVATPFGTLLLDPSSLLVLATPTVTASRVAPTALPIPADPALVGAVVPLQVAGAVRNQPLWLGRAVRLSLLP